MPAYNGNYLIRSYINIHVSNEEAKVRHFKKCSPASQQCYLTSAITISSHHRLGLILESVNGTGNQ